MIAPNRLLVIVVRVVGSTYGASCRLGLEGRAILGEIQIAHQQRAIVGAIDGVLIAKADRGTRPPCNDSVHVRASGSAAKHHPYSTLRCVNDPGAGAHQHDKV